MYRNIIFSAYLKTAIKISLLVIFILVATSPKVFSQDTIASVKQSADSTIIEKHSPHKATIYSLVLPGLGQAYNKKYWKIPIIYAGFGALAYNLSINNKEMRKFTEAYRYRLNGDTTFTNNPYVARYTDVNDLLRGRDFYRRRVELTVIFSAVWYILNVVDATVDAHFFDYDVSDNISLNIQPIMIKAPGNHLATGGIRLCMNF